MQIFTLCFLLLAAALFCAPGIALSKRFSMGRGNSCSNPAIGGTATSVRQCIGTYISKHINPEPGSIYSAGMTSQQNFRQCRFQASIVAFAEIAVHASQNRGRPEASQ